MSNILYIVWSEKDNTGVSILDEQHRAIVATINSLFFFIQEGWGIQALSPTLTIIKSYSNFHCKSEEGVLAKVNYPNIEQHAQLQKIFIQEIDHVAHRAIESRDPDILLKFVKNWWLKHLQNDHLLYAKYLNKFAKI